VNLEADFEQAEGLAVLGVVEDVLKDSGQQRGAHQDLIAGDGVRDANVGGGVETEGGDGLLAQEE